MNDGKLTIAECLRDGKPVCAYTVGKSMQPLLYEGSTHVIARPAAHTLKKGELPIYLRPDGKYVIHRIISADEDSYFTRGDNCLSGEKIPHEWVIGVVEEIYRGGRYIKVTSPGYRLYVRLWCISYPARALFYRLRARLER